MCPVKDSSLIEPELKLLEVDDGLEVGVGEGLSSSVEVGEGFSGGGEEVGGEGLTGGGGGGGDEDGMGVKLGMVELVGTGSLGLGGTLLDGV